MHHGRGILSPPKLLCFCEVYLIFPLYNAPMKEIEGYIEHGIGDSLKVGTEVTIAFFTPIAKRLEEPMKRRWREATKGRRRLAKLNAMKLKLQNGT